MLLQLFGSQIARNPDSVAFITKESNKTVALSWKEADEKSNSIASYLLGNDVVVQDKVGIFANNSIEWSLIDIACLKVRACSVPIYSTTIEEHLIHIINDAEMKVIFVGDEEQLEKVNRIRLDCPTLEKVVLISESKRLGDGANATIAEVMGTNVNAEKLKDISLQIKKEDLVTLIYTSGTTGMPKGVMLDNENFAAAIDSHRDRIEIRSSDKSLCFLPLSHIFERAWTYYVLTCGGSVHYLQDPSTVAASLKEVKPTVMCSVPRFFEKVYTKVSSDLDSASSSKQNLFKWATRVGRKIFARKTNNEFINPWLLAQYYIAKKLVYSKFKSQFGGEIRFFNCGGASLQDDVNMFFQSLGLPIIYGYGLTETLATVSCYTKIPAIGSVGKPMKGVEVKIGDNDEILVKGASITKGYYRLDEENKKAFTEDGWFKTGDAGRIDSEGNIYYSERIKDLMKTSNGKYVAPQNVEGTLLKDKFIDQVAIIAEGETFVSALIVPDYPMLAAYAKEKAIAFKDEKELLAHSEIIQMLESRIKTCQEKLNGFEKVKKFKLLEAPFTIAANEITPTLKLKRKVILSKYKHLIAEMYGKKPVENTQ